MADDPKSLEDAERLLALLEKPPWPDNRTIVSAAACALDFGLFDETIKVFEQIVDHPATERETAFKTILALTSVLSGMRDFDGAVELFHRAHEIKPSSMLPWVNISRHSRVMRDHETAIHAAEKAFQINAIDGQTFAEVTRSYSFAGRLDEFQDKHKDAVIPTKNPIELAGSLFDLGAYDQAEQVLAGRASFLTPQYLRQNALTSQKLGESYPALDGAWPDDKSIPVYFMACDQKYFDIYAEPFLKSVDRLTETRAVHLHVYDPQRSVEDLLTTLQQISSMPHISITTEKIPTPDKTYYSSARFVRFSQLLAQHEAPVANLDADSLVVRDVFHDTDADIVGFERPEFCSVKQRFYAAFLRAQPTDGARRFLDMLATFIALAFHLNRAQWYVDQMGLLLAHKVLVEQDQSVRWHDLTHTEVQYQYLQDDALVWAGKGLQKSFPKLPDLSPA